MDFDPQNWFIGLMDFFSILLPGALLTYLLMDQVGPVLLTERYGKLAGSEGWAAFIFASYLFGHLVFLLGSWLDEFYDWARGYTLNKQIRRLALRNKLLPWPLRLGVWAVFRRESNHAVRRAEQVKKRLLSPLQADQAVNTFQWCKVWLNVESQPCLQAVQRLEADSKFFRSFVVVLAVVLITWPWHHPDSPLGALAVATLLLLALWRYMEQRHKATNQAYWSVLTLTANNNKGKLSFPEPGPPPQGSPAHAGGVVMRGHGTRTRYLLVEASDNPLELVLPTGDIEPQEDSRQTAVREVHEETGVWARIVGEPEDVSLSVNGKEIKARTYAMRAIGYGRRKDRQRGHRWLRLQEVLNHKPPIHSKMRQLLEAAAQQSARRDRA
jgi:ADP-ribose pyrophosphatase YjhB (NUDIX family)